MRETLLLSQNTEAEADAKIETVAAGDEGDRPIVADAETETVAGGDEERAVVADAEEIEAVAGTSDVVPLDWPVEQSEEHARACRRLARNILVQVPPSGGMALLFTSPTGGEGKTELLVSLAAELAKQAGDDVLLVDGDLKIGEQRRASGAEVAQRAGGRRDVGGERLASPGWRHPGFMGLSGGRAVARTGGSSGGHRRLVGGRAGDDGAAPGRVARGASSRA